VVTTAIVLFHRLCLDYNLSLPMDSLKAKIHGEQVMRLINVTDLEGICLFISSDSVTPRTPGHIDFELRVFCEKAGGSLAPRGFSIPSTTFPPTISTGKQEVDRHYREMMVNWV